MPEEKSVRLHKKAIAKDEAESETPPPRGLPAVLRLARDGKLVLEVTLEGVPLAWDPPAAVKVELDDGTVEEAEVDRNETTAPATLVPPQCLRLVLRAPSLAPRRITRILLEVAGAVLVLDVQH